MAKVLPFKRDAESAAAATELGEAAVPTSAQDISTSSSFQTRLRERVVAAQREVSGVTSLLEELKSHELGQWPELFAGNPRYRSLALVGEIVDHSWAVGYQEPLRAVEIARLALDLLDRVPAGRYGVSLVEGLRIRAWTRVGTGYRLAGDLVSSESAFRRAQSWIESCPDPQERAGHFFLYGLLRKDQRRFDEAIALFDQAHRLSTEVDDRDRLLRVLISTGSLHMERGDPEEALPILLDALSLTDERTEARVALFARSNLANCFIELADYAGAREMFQSCRAEYAASEDSFVRLRALWMEGRIESGLGDIARAEHCLAAVRTEYLERGQHYDAALVSLHLAELFARTGRTSQVRVLAEEMATVFLAQDIPAEAMAALAFFRQAVEQERATEQLVSGVARFLQRAQADPALEFRGI